MNSKRGVFVCFEGIDGSGKSTQARKFVEYLFSLNKTYHVVFTREPYKDLKIREILSQDKDPMSKSKSLTELFVKDRENHVNELIFPALENSWHIVCDRYKLSTICYQAAQGMNVAELLEMHKDFPDPDITFIVDLPAEISMERMKNDGTREMKNEKFETNPGFLESVRKNYLEMPDLFPAERIFILDGKKSTEEIFNEAKRIFDREIISSGFMAKKRKYTTMKEVPARLKNKLGKYFSNVGGNTFAISNLPSELTGGSLARYSRAPTSMQLTIVNEFLDDNGEPSQTKGSEIMDRVLNAYGDDSVGELEGAHIGIENISQLLTKTIEDRRIGGSPIEQSTRYVRYDQKDSDGKWKYLRPKEILESRFAEKYERINDETFGIYSELVNKLIEYFRKKISEEDFEIEVERETVSREKVKMKCKKREMRNVDEEKSFKIAYDFSVRCAALDVARCVLPTSTLTQIGIFGNGRYFSNLLSTLKSGELEEEKIKGREIESELRKIIPTFIKRNKENPKISEINKKMREISKEFFSGISINNEKVVLIKEEDYLDKTVAFSVYPYAQISMTKILEILKKVPEEKKLEILGDYTGKRESRRDRTGRGFEAGYPLTFDLICCFGEYRDLERHRILTQQRQLFTTELGFVVPYEVYEVGMGNAVEEIAKKFDELNKELRTAGIIAASQYVTLFNHKIRFVMGMNLREFQHLAELRSQPAGHYGYRSLVMEMANKVREKYPWTEKALQFVDYSDPENKISRAKEQSRIAGGNLSKGISGDLDF